ncbi:MAG: hypothetical protein A2Z98_06140 [Spirochaetes bacterium GWB1_27_13]|nr:MAG: hypothetical protein A2Z98_06140 [Spirochaetes bacterium GWB1_27_13]
MKKIILVLSIFLILFIGCKKSDVTTTTTQGDNSTTNVTQGSTENSTTSMLNQNMYVKYQVWFYEKESDIGKQAKDVKEKKLMEFGNKVTITKERKINDILYYQVQIPDKTTYWVSSENLTQKFITINQPDVVCYKQPDTDYANTAVKLQAGDFAYFVKEQDGFINVDFISYMPRGKKEQGIWVGNVWLKTGYTEDTKVARESYILSRAYNDLYGKNVNPDSAIEKLKQALEINNGEETEITYVIKNLLNQLGVTSGDNTTDK